MKQFAFIIFFMWAFLACHQKSELEIEFDHQAGILPTSIGQVADVFELKYGEVKECNYGGQLFSFSITDIEDNRAPCHLMDLSGIPEEYWNFGMHVYFCVKIDGKISQLKVPSRFCSGTLEYEDSNAVQQIWDELEKWESERINSLNSDCFNYKFRLAYAGTLIENTPFSIYLAEADPPINDWDDLASEIEKEQYRFIFIITKK